MKKKLVSTILTTAMLVSVFAVAGCGNSANDSADANANAGAEAGAAAGTETAADTEADAAEDDQLAQILAKWTINSQKK